MEINAPDQVDVGTVGMDKIFHRPLVNAYFVLKLRVERRPKELEKFCVQVLLSRHQGRAGQHFANILFFKGNGNLAANVFQLRRLAKPPGKFTGKRPPIIE